MDEAVTVFTAIRRDDIINRGGIGNWVLNPRRASECPYLVCCRKARWDNRDEGIAKRAAFLVGRINKLKPAAEFKNARGQQRYFIEISEYAELNEPDVWGDWR